MREPETYQWADEGIDHQPSEAAAERKVRPRASIWNRVLHNITGDVRYLFDESQTLQDTTANLENKTSGFSEDGTALGVGDLNNTRIVAPSIPGAFETITAAYNDLPSEGGEIYLAESISDSGILFEKPVTLTGRGSGRSGPTHTTLDVSGGNGIHIMSKHVTLRDLHIEGGGSDVTDYGVKIGEVETDQFIENVNLDNVSVINCYDGFWFGGRTQSICLNILSGGNQRGINVYGTDRNADGETGNNDWFNSTWGRVMTQDNSEYGLYVHGGIHFNGNDWVFSGENPGSTWDMNVSSSVDFSGNTVRGYGWHDTGLRCIAGGQGNKLHGRILRGGKELDFGGEFTVGHDGVGDGRRIINSETKIGCLVELDSDQVISDGDRSIVQFDSVVFDHWDTYDTENHTYEIAETGVHRVQAKLRISAGGSEDAELILRLMDGNGISFCTDRQPATGDMITMQVSKTEHFYSGDEITVEFEQNSGTDRTLSQYSADSHFEITRLG